MQTLENEQHTAADAEETHWYAIHTRYQHESQVNQQLESKGFQTFYPTCTKRQNWSDRQKTIHLPLFPGYLFVTEIENRQLHVVTTPGVCGIVSIAGVPAAIPYLEIAAIRRAVASPLTVEAHSYLNTGDQVRVIEGPLDGVTGILVRNEKSTKLVLSVELLGRSVAVCIDARSVVRAVAQ